MRLLRAALGLSVLSEMALCPRLWGSGRGFPVIPVFPFLPPLPSGLTLTLTGLFVVSVLAAAFLPRTGWALFVVPILGAALVLFDVNRLQPWFYQALLMFVALASPRERERLCAFVLAATYFWSGLQKANLSFGERVFPWLLQPLGLEALRPLWHLAPIVEASVGLMLLLPRFRTWGLTGAGLMHAFLLLALGPLGQNANSVVWPWNVWMPLLTFVAFFRNPETILPVRWSHPVVILAGGLPALNLFGLGDDYLADSLYAGRTRQAFILLTEGGARRLPAEALPYVQRRPDRMGIDIARWALADLNVPPYPEVRVYREVARRLVREGVPEGEMTLIVTDRPGIARSRSEFRPVPIGPVPLKP